MTELIQLKYTDKPIFRKKWHIKQKGICPILKTKVLFKETSIDHKHKSRKDKLGGKEGLGLVRGVIHRQANSWEGKVYNSYIRLGLSKFIDFPSALENLADYIRNPPIPPIYIYPGEQEKRKKLGKRAYNKVVKYYFKVYPRRRSLPKKTKYLTKDWEGYIIDVENYLKSIQKKKKRRRKKK